MFKDKGIIIKTALSENVTGAVGIYQQQVGGDVALAKVTVMRKRQNGKYKYAGLHKNWLSIREVYATIAVLQRVALLLEEYYDGTLDLKDILAEDESIREDLSVQSRMKPDFKDLFDFSVATTEKEKDFDE